MELPAPTTDIARAVADLRSTGVAIVRNAVDPAVIAAARRDLERVAAQERASGRAILEDGSAIGGNYRPGPNQRIVQLLGKGSAFAPLACHDVPMNVTRRLFADSYGYPDDVVSQLGLDELRLSSVTANIANRGGAPMGLHADQGFTPTTGYPILVNALWPLVDMDEANGATEVAPGSHVAEPTALYASAPDAFPVTAAAGSVILIDGRTWHRTGANSTASSRPVVLVAYCRPWVRPFDDDIAIPTRALMPVDPWFVYDLSAPSV